MRSTKLYIQTLGFLVFVCVLFIPVGVGAHGDGASLEATVDGMLIDIGYSPEGIVAGTPVPFDFSLLAAETGEAITYSDIWVRVHRERDIFFAGGVHRAQVGATTLLFQFPEEGTYTLSVRFQREGEPVAETSFEVPVAASAAAASRPQRSAWPLLLGVVFGGVFGGTTVWLLERRRHHKKQY